MTIDFEAGDPRTTAPRRQRVYLSGYKVGALDGDAGTIDGVTWENGFPCIVVKLPRRWFFGKKVMMAARLIKRIDSDELRVYVNRTKDQIKKAPDYKPSPLNRSAGTR